MAKIKWPGDAVSGADLADPIAGLLQRLHLLGDDEPTDGGLLRTPYSVQVLKSGALAVTKVWTGLTAAGGAAVVGTAWADFDGQGTEVKTAIVAGTALLVAVVALAIAVIVKADVNGRVVATVSRVEAGTAIARDFLDKAAGFQRTGPGPAGAGLPAAELELLLAFAAHPETLRVATATKDLQGVNVLWSEGGKLRMTLADHESIAVSAVTRYTTEPPPHRPPGR
ncbi:hypothetical protein [Kitasatospora sp. NPDC057223]|uniref:hypothetical protein n=1 Tax=Kitasatospora sp. NPDC057223 TaxID=3346055 RepID=UPI00363F4BF7